MKNSVATKTIAKINAKGYKFSYLINNRCFIKKFNGLSYGREIFFDNPTQALKYITNQI